MCSTASKPPAAPEKTPRPGAPSRPRASAPTRGGPTAAPSSSSACPDAAPPSQGSWQACVQVRNSVAAAEVVPLNASWSAGHSVRFTHAATHTVTPLHLAVALGMEDGGEPVGLRQSTRCSAARVHSSPPLQPTADRASATSVIRVPARVLFKVIVLVPLLRCRCAPPRAPEVKGGPPRADPGRSSDARSLVPEAAGTSKPRNASSTRSSSRAQRAGELSALEITLERSHGAALTKTSPSLLGRRDSMAAKRHLTALSSLERRSTSETGTPGSDPG